MFDEVMEQIEYVRSNGMDYIKYAKLFIKSEPYCKYQELVEKLKGELNINE